VLDKVHTVVSKPTFELRKEFRAVIDQLDLTMF